MNILDISKTIIRVAVSAGVGAIVTNAVKSTTPSDIKTINKILVGLGSFVVSGMIAEKACDYAVEQVDGIVEFVKESTSAIKDEIQNQSGVKTLVQVLPDPGIMTDGENVTILIQNNN